MNEELVKLKDSQSQKLMGYLFKIPANTHDVQTQGFFGWRRKNRRFKYIEDLREFGNRTLKVATT